MHQKQKSKLITEPDYHSSDEFYCGRKFNANLPPAFDIGNYNDPETKQYSYWYHDKPDETCPAKLMYEDVTQENLLELDDFLLDMFKTYQQVSSSNEPDILAID